MTQPAKGQEPSMEEILASIRRIIADEGPSDSAAHAGGAADAPPPPRMVSPPPRPAPLPPEPVTREEEIDSMLARIQAAPRPAPPPLDQPAVSERAAEKPRAAADAGERGLMSAATSAALDSAFHALAQSAQAQAAQARDGRTLEEVVSELLRPMLKAWLDDNLPDLVERLVRAEIERVSRGR
jgi:cell pole-organizing protein PopZ